MSARPYINMHTYNSYLENAVDFDVHCAHETTAVPSIIVLYPEVWYGLVRPINVCQCCFVLGRLCFNFTARVAGGNQSTRHCCDQCGMGHIAGCSTNDYATKRVNTEMLYPSVWYYCHIIQARRTSEQMGRVCTIVGAELEQNDLNFVDPPVLPRYRNGVIIDFGTYQNLVGVLPAPLPLDSAPTRLTGSLTSVEVPTLAENLVFVAPVEEEINELDDDDDNFVATAPNVHRSAHLGRCHVPFMGDNIDNDDLVNPDLDLAEFDYMNSEELAGLVSPDELFDREGVAPLADFHFDGTPDPKVCGSVPAGPDHPMPSLNDMVTSVGSGSHPSSGMPSGSSHRTTTSEKCRQVE
ncbi:hypothetical protein INT45_009104 [Circinella minor]|uniref:Uncharacterized protein n=1 Tax=Circinella minor TaxID=1195481 RepID=A0A8H7RQL2_9FUNG|nr:hypothetical protein INT45_009104 [Circinella minor]